MCGPVDPALGTTPRPDDTRDRKPSRLPVLAGGCLGDGCPNGVRAVGRETLGWSRGRDPRSLQEAPLDIPDDVYRALELEISSDTSPVGIDAKKTHVIILHQLARIEERLRRIEARLDQG